MNAYDIDLRAKARFVHLILVYNTDDFPGELQSLTVTLGSHVDVSGGVRGDGLVYEYFQKSANRCQLGHVYLQLKWWCMIGRF